MPELMSWIAMIYGAASVCALGLYALDKERARRGGRRIPEATLHLVELLGGWPGAYVGQQVYRHKTKKPSYQLVFWLIVALHLAGWLWYLRQG